MGQGYANQLAVLVAAREAPVDECRPRPKNGHRGSGKGLSQPDQSQELIQGVLWPLQHISHLLGQGPQKQNRVRVGELGESGLRTFLPA